jgi:hypothetical protein
MAKLYRSQIDYFIVLEDCLSNTESTFKTILRLQLLFNFDGVKRWRKENDGGNVKSKQVSRRQSARCSKIRRRRSGVVRSRRGRRRRGLHGGEKNTMRKADKGRFPPSVRVSLVHLFRFFDDADAVRTAVCALC